MDEYKVKISKLNNTGTKYDSVKLPVIEESQLSDLLLAFFAADFEDRERLIKLLKI